MDFGYKAYLALILATAACWRTKAQNNGTENLKDSIEVNNPQNPEIKNDSTIMFEEAPRTPDLSNTTIRENDGVTAVKNDSALLEEICQSLADIEHNAVRFIAHFESIKMNAYFDKVAKKWTIGFGNTTHPDGRPIRKGDKIKDEAELMLYFREYFKNNVAPVIAQFFPNFPKLEEHEKIALIDLFWNAGGGVLSTRKEYDKFVQNLSEEQRQEVAQLLQNKDEKVEFEGNIFSLRDIPEWSNLSVSEQTTLQPMYSNTNIVKGGRPNPFYNTNIQILDRQQRIEVTGMLTDLQNKHQSLSALSLQRMPETWNSAIVNDSTVRYRGYLVEQEYTFSDIPMWYRFKAPKQEQIAKLLASKNGSILYKGHSVAYKDISAYYFLSKSEQKLLKESVPASVLLRKSTDNNKKPVLSNLAYELNAYALTKDPVARERVATRMTTFTRSRGKVVSALQKRANIRAQVFLGRVKLNGGDDNAINLETIRIGAGYLVNPNDLNNPTAISDTINKCTHGLNFGDTMQLELSRTNKIAHTSTKARGRTSYQTQTRAHRIRSSVRGR